MNRLQKLEVLEAIREDKKFMQEMEADECSSYAMCKDKARSICRELKISPVMRTDIIQIALVAARMSKESIFEM